MPTDSELKLYYVLPSGQWELKTGAVAEPVAAFRNREDAHHYLERLERLGARRKAPGDKDPNPQE